MFSIGASALGRGGTGPFRLIQRLVVLGFAVIQLFLVARILMDLGVFTEQGGISEFIITVSDALAAPVEGIADSLFGGDGGIGPTAGEGFNGVMVAALAGWSVVEGLVMRVVGKLASV